MSEIGGIPMGLIVLLFIVVYCFILNAVMNYADRKGRDKTFWVFIGIVFSPIIATFLLFLYGESKEHRKERIIEEELWKRNCETEVEKIKKEAEKKRIKEEEANPLSDMYRS